jgi:hypothetical protein
LILFKRRLQERENEVRQREEEVCRKAQSTECESDRLEGLKKCAEQRIPHGVLLLARAFTKAVELGDKKLERGIWVDLLLWLRKVNEPPDSKLMGADLRAVVDRLVKATARGAESQGEFDSRAFPTEPDESSRASSRSAAVQWSDAERKEAVQLWVEVVTHMEINGRGDLQPLNNAWLQCRDRLFNLIGISEFDTKIERG